MNQLKFYVSNQLARKLYYAFVYSNISYGIEVYVSCSDTSLDRLQVIQNKLLKLLLRLDPSTSTNLLLSELNILKVKDLYNAGQLDYRRARLDLGTSKVQYHAAKLWNLSSDAVKKYSM